MKRFGKLCPHCGLPMAATFSQDQDRVSPATTPGPGRLVFAVILLGTGILLNVTAAARYASLWWTLVLAGTGLALYGARADWSMLCRETVLCRLCSCCVCGYLWQQHEDRPDEALLA